MARSFDEKKKLEKLQAIEFTKRMRSVKDTHDRNLSLNEQEIDRLKNLVNEMEAKLKSLSA